jgi:hypothetical protein
MSSIMVSAWMERLATMVATYDREAVVVSVVEKDVDPRTSFLAAACRSRLAVMAYSSARS